MTGTHFTAGRWRTALIGCFLLPLAAGPSVWAQTPTRLDWPAPTKESRPWTRWWWHGSAVDKPNLTRLLEEYRDAGLGGVEITCIYGVQGMEERNRRYRSDEWVDAVRHAISEADRLGMGVDLPAGSGWRMGGPMVEPEDANSKLVIETDEVAGGETLTKRFRRVTPQVVAAHAEDGRRVVLTDQIENDRLQWNAPEGDWTVYALGYRWAGDRVKRPGPGGEGLNINPYSKASVSKFLEHFGRTLDELPGIRAQFHDSFEYEGDWQPEFLEEFAERRGYRLEDHLQAFAGEGDEETVARIKCDYRETLAELVLEDLVQTWVDWSHEHGMLARNQAHGSPGNWLDLYAACDIPETESFGRLHGADAQPLVLKFAGSAGNVAGRKLVSSETATWLDEHFNVTLAQVRQVVDRQILAGVNHVFYHGTAYSPDDAQWPGWLFYASTQLNPQNPLWRDFPALNAYVGRCQAVLQDARPHNDILLYWPIHDAWHDARGYRKDIRVHNSRAWFDGHPIGDAAGALFDAGYAFDYVSDRLLARCEGASEGRIQAPGGTYRAVVVPKAEHMPLATLQKLAALARSGAKVVFWGGLPASAPGLGGAEASAEWNEAIASLRDASGEGVLLSDELFQGVRQAGVEPEGWAGENGLAFVRKQNDHGVVYFINNVGDEAFDGWIKPTAAHAHAAIMDAMNGRIGAAQTDEENGVRVQLAARQSLLVVVSDDRLNAEPWLYWDPAGEAATIDGPWRVTFLEGGPETPESFTSDEPQPWTEASDPAAEKFAGAARYSVTFDAPEGAAPDGRWLLDLGEVLGSARVRLNGEEVATLFAPPYKTALGSLEPTGNTLEVEVTGVAANRIRDLDQRGVEWRIFEDINLVNIDYRRFDASGWPVRPLGLDGPVTLTPLVPEPQGNN